MRAGSETQDRGPRDQMLYLSAADDSKPITLLPAGQWARRFITRHANLNLVDQPVDLQIMVGLNFIKLRVTGD